MLPVLTTRIQQILERRLYLPFFLLVFFFHFRSFYCLNIYHLHAFLIKSRVYILTCSLPQALIWPLTWQWHSYMSPSKQGWGIPCWPQEEGPGELYNSADVKASHLPGEFNQYDKKLAQGPNPHSWGTRPWALNAAAVGTPESGVGNWRWSTDSSVPSRRWLWLQKRKRNFRVFCTTCVRCTLHIENKLPVLKPCPMLLHFSPGLSPVTVNLSAQHRAQWEEEKGRQHIRTKLRARPVTASEASLPWTQGRWEKKETPWTLQLALSYNMTGRKKNATCFVVSRYDFWKSRDGETTKRN